MIVITDIETISDVDLMKVGAYNYASHPSADLICLAYSVYDPVKQFVTFPQSLFPIDFILNLPAAQKFNEYLKVAQLVVAHNSAFERYMWKFVLTKKYRMVPVDFKQWECTMARCAYYGLPLALPKPDTRGQNAMKRVCVNPEKRRRGDLMLTAEYNEQDIKQTVALFFNLPALLESERQIWLEDQRINDRGIPLDVRFVRYAKDLVEKNKDQLLKDFQAATNYEVRTPSCVGQFKQWLASRGIVVDDLQEPTVTKLLNDPSIDSQVQQALECRSHYASVSVKKYEKMMLLVGEDGYVRGQFQYSAAITHRWGGRGVQPQNLPRGTEDPEIAIKRLSDGDLSTDLLLSAIRGAIKTPEGMQLVCIDFIGIEPRVRCWLADDQMRLKMFRNKVDLYLIAASKVYDRTVTKEDKTERLVGKINELAFGYGGGFGAVSKFAADYKLDIAALYDDLWSIATQNEKESALWMLDFHKKQDPEFDEPEKKVLAAEILKIKWRADNDKTVQLWYELEQTMITALHNPNKRQYCCNKKISYLFNGKTCMCYLPGGNEIIYRNARITDDGIRYTHGNKATYTYGGKLLENLCQSIGRNLFTDGLLALSEKELQTSMHVHDEYVLLTKQVEGATKTICHLLKNSMPKWSKDIPIDFDGWEGERYRK